MLWTSKTSGSVLYRVSLTTLSVVHIASNTRFKGLEDELLGKHGSRASSVDPISIVALAKGSVRMIS